MSKWIVTITIFFFFFSFLTKSQRKRGKQGWEYVGVVLVACTYYREEEYNHVYGYVGWMEKKFIYLFKDAFQVYTYIRSQIHFLSDACKSHGMVLMDRQRRKQA